MLTGRPPFRGKTGVDTMHAILHDPPPPLPALGGAATAEASADMTRIIDKCLAKDPSERYQGMRDIVVDLRSARRRLESSAVRPIPAARVNTTREGLMHAQQWVYYGVAAVVLLLVGFGALKLRLTKPRTPDAAAAVGVDAKPSVAVLYFENNTGNPQLDWLRTGLTDMLVTDLSQSPDVEVLPTDRLVQILAEMRRQDDKQISFDTVQEVAKRAGVKQVVLGSYVKAGETIRINLKLQDAATGRLVTAERVEAIGESNLFPTVDDLTKRIRAKFALPRVDPAVALLKGPTTITTTTGTSIDRDLKDVTTSSIEAYRAYAEGINLHERGRDTDAIVPLQRAVQLDPSFAMAWTKLGVAEGNLGHRAKSVEADKRAFQHVDHLTLRERLYVEAVYYTDSSETFQRGLDTYKKAIDLFPDHASAKHNLALTYFQLGRDREAIPLYEDLLRRGMVFAQTYGQLAAAYARQGDAQRAEAVLREYIQKSPDNAVGYRSLAQVLAQAGKLDDAAAAADKALALDPADAPPSARALKHAIAVVGENWDAADAIDRESQASTEARVRLLGALDLANDRLYRGRSADAIAALSSAVKSGGDAATFAGRTALASILLDLGKPADAVAEARRAIAELNGFPAANLDAALFVVAVGEQRLGHATESAKAADQIVRRANEQNRGGAGQYRLAATLALARGDLTGALDAVAKGNAMLPPVPGNVDFLFTAGTVSLAAGRTADAEAAFERLAASGTRRAGAPLAFVRSLYALGQINERKGDRAKASDYWRRFLHYWGDGDIDRDRVADARRKLAGS
jgi:tetratricopeptide (TPR) repeat protein